jgi:DNA anti-recombination protein RmuC
VSSTQVDDIERKLVQHEEDIRELYQLVENTRTEMREGFARVDQRFVRLEATIGHVQTNLENKIGTLDAKIDSVQTSLDTKIDGMQTSLENRIDQVQTRLENKIDRILAAIEKR